MRTYTILFILLLLITSPSCNNGESASIDLVTGLDLFDANGLPIGRWNIPNHKRGESAIYPVPSNGVISIDSRTGITKVWVVEGTCISDNNQDLLESSQSLTYELDDIMTAAILDFEADNKPSLQIELAEFGIGFYKVFFTLENGELYWQNVYIDPTATNFPDFSFLDRACI